MSRWLEALSYPQLFALSAALAVGLVLALVAGVLIWHEIDWHRHEKRGDVWVVDSWMPYSGHWEGGTRQQN